MISSFFYRLIVGSNFIPRRNFHKTLKNYSFVTRCLFKNNFLRKLLEFISDLFPDSSQIARSIRIRLFYCQHAPINSQDDIPIKFEKNTHTIDYGCETRDALILKQNEKISTLLDVQSDSNFSTGICVLENIVNIDSKVLLDDVIINIEILSTTTDKEKTLSFPLSVDDKKHGILHNVIGENWFDFSVELDEFKDDRISITMSAFFSNKTFTMFGNKSDFVKTIKFELVPCIAFSLPKLTNKDPNKKNILLISGESFTDPFWLEKVHDNPVFFPNITNLAKDSIRYDRSYSMVDSTLPSVMSYFAGLFPSQHSFGDYSSPLYFERPCDDVESISSILKKNGFSTICQTSYPRFDPLYGWGKGFDRYFQAEYPWSNNAPDASKVIRSFEALKNHDIFMFVHLTRLHGPFLSSDILQNPQENKAEEMNSAKNGNFLPMYLSQIKIFDEQIGAIVDYLKRTNQYKNTMILLTGDHGVSMPPNRKTTTSIKYAHYEEHSRVPLIIKTPSWFKKHPAIKYNPISTQKEIFDTILESNKINPPNYFNKLPQYSDDFKDYAISETVYHPNIDNYAITLISSKFKYWLFTKVDWSSLEIITVLDEKLFNVTDSDGTVDESLNIINESPEISSILKNKAIDFFNISCQFRAQNSTIKYPETMN